METLGLKNINMLSKAQYDGVVEPAVDELWAVETETYHDDDGNWYRVYPDGWCEQGGVISSSTPNTQTVNFLKEFLNTNYILDYQINANSSNTRTFQTYGYNKTTTNFTVNNANVVNTTWTAKGYIA